MESYLNYTIEDHEGIRIVNLNGNISNSSKNELSRLIGSLIAKGNVILNMKGVDVVTSSGINVLVNLSIESRQKSKRLLLLGAGENVRKMIDVLDLYEYFIMVDSVEEGQMKLKYYL